MEGTPVWSQDSIICTGESYKNAVKLTFAKGVSLKDPARLFKFAGLCASESISEELGIFELTNRPVRDHRRDSRAHWNHQHLSAKDLTNSDISGQSAADRRNGQRMNLQSLIFAGFSGATRRIRTDDLLITNSCSTN